MHAPNVSTGMPLRSVTQYRKSAKKLRASQCTERSSCGVVHRQWLGDLTYPGTYQLPLFSLQYSRPNRTETGATIDGGEDFSTFLGPMFMELQEKYRQWLQLTYCMFIISGLPSRISIDYFLQRMNS